MLEILDETVAYYGSDPVNKRGQGMSGCKYLTLDGKMCAVGRCCAAPSEAWFGGCENIRGTDVSKFLNLEDLLKPEYKGHNIQFWCDLQSLHDTKAYFTDTGFSAKGLAWIANIRKGIIEKQYDVQNKTKA